MVYVYDLFRTPHRSTYFRTQYTGPHGRERELYQSTTQTLDLLLLEVFVLLGHRDLCFVYLALRSPERKFRFRILLSSSALKCAAAAAAGVGSKRASCCARDRWTVNDSEFLSVSFKTLSDQTRPTIDGGIDAFGIR